jgi:hypothetical protein
MVPERLRLLSSTTRPLLRANSSRTARQYQLDVPHADELFERGQNRQLLIVLRKIEPDAGIDKNLEQADFSLLRTADILQALCAR